MKSKSLITGLLAGGNGLLILLFIYPLLFDGRNLEKFFPDFNIFTPFIILPFWGIVVCFPIVCFLVGFLWSQKKESAKILLIVYTLIISLYAIFSILIKKTGIMWIFLFPIVTIILFTLSIILIIKITKKTK